ncbi:hypothetical protein [Moorena sp. SIO4G3]|uniref:hypothetical protein n=1 Tax=Moorena sp. SIO4G3 TaxID=2607821 RepID=UPI00142C34E6|nr:hypothetical protein [Moorena sp. SIO4G3]NEO76414.1 hypothetical protein [Moorena sp. SIO4G3]
MFHYQAYGLTIQSVFLLNELTKSKNTADIYIEKGKVKLPQLEPTSINRQGKEAHFGGNTQEAYLRWHGIATLLAKNGDTIIVDPDSDDIDPQRLSLYILSEALGLILYQRGLFLLHASAVKIGEQVVIFAGCPGAGKSTTAAAFAKLGYTVVSDDMVAIDLNSGDKPMVYPAFPQIKIWPPTVEGLGYDISTLPTLYPGSRKRVIRKPENFPTQPFPLAHIFFLEDGRDFKVTPMAGNDAFLTLARFFPLPSQLLAGKTLEHYFQQCLQLINQVELWKIEKPKDFRILNKLITWVEQKIETSHQSAQDVYLLQQ